MYKTVAILMTFLAILALQPASSAAAEKARIPSPMQQMRMHVSINNIVCTDGLQVAMKKSDGSPACVRASSLAILIARGWALHVLPAYSKEGTKNSDMFDGGPMPIKASNAVYFGNTTGYVAMPIQKGRFPGVILIHEW